jgi:hypothetical protein
MPTPTREHALEGGRDHRNPRPASIGTGGRLRSESTADFIGIRNIPALAIRELGRAVLFAFLGCIGLPEPHSRAATIFIDELDAGCL